MQKKLFIISVGGSRINPGQVDTDFLKKFRTLILNQIKKGNRFILITGGGKISRQYQDALRQLGKPAATELDWMGIYATRFNARLVQLMFGKLANANVVEDPNKKVIFKEKVLVAGGWMPGRSTDDDAVRLAKAFKANTVINLFDQDYLYDKDPRKFKDAKKIKSISWTDFKKIVGTKWDPGKNSPFDPTATTLAAKLKLKVIIANGKNLKNLQNILNSKPFLGTTIQ